MKYKTLKQGLEAFVFGIGIDLGIIGLSGCSNNYQSDFYKRIETSTLSEEQKMNIKDFYLSIDLDNLSPEETNFLRLSDRQKKELLMPDILEFYTQTRLIDINNITPTDYIFLFRVEEFIVYSYIFQQR